MTQDAATDESLLLIPQGSGEHFNVAGAKLTWKVKSDMTDMGFCFFEQVLAPGEGVPLHEHDFTEAFYILAGTVTFFGGPGTEQPIRSNAGDVVLARTARLHGFANLDNQEARLLSISVPEHQRFFDAVAAGDRDEPFATMPPEAMMQRVVAIGAATGAVFAAPDNAG
jgi:quercetin dioxygenase-like cupin family protein